jgi:Beta-ketoacyl synthase, N-terminal domain
MNARPLCAYVDGVGLLGPGFASWDEGAPILRGVRALVHEPTVLPPPEGLPPAERRRAGSIVRLALAAGQDALRQAGAQVHQLPTVFTSSGGDGPNCHEVCAELTAGRQLSPTRFHNSVHNAAAGYWGIATGSTASANALCAHDASFAAGLIEALTQVVTERTPVLLIAYDTPYPEPLHRVRPIPDAFATALLLTPGAGAATLARIEAHWSDAPPTPIEEPLEALRCGIPAARSLPLLQHLARSTVGTVVLEYLEPLRLAVGVIPCR